MTRPTPRHPDPSEPAGRGARPWEGLVDDATLIAYIDGELDAARAARVRKRLREHPEAERALNALIRDRERLRATPTPPAPHGLLARALAVAEDIEPTSQRSPRLHEAHDLPAASSDELAALRSDLAQSAARGRRRRRWSALAGSGALVAALALVVALWPMTQGQSRGPGGPAGQARPMAAEDLSAPETLADADTALSPSEPDDADEPVATIAAAPLSAPALESASARSRSGPAAEAMPDLRVGPMVGRVVREADRAVALAAEGRLLVRVVTRRPDRTAPALERLAAKAGDASSWTLARAPLHDAEAWDELSEADPQAALALERLASEALAIEAPGRGPARGAGGASPLGDPDLVANQRRNAPDPVGEALRRRNAADGAETLETETEAMLEAGRRLSDVGAAVYLLRVGSDADALVSARDGLGGAPWVRVEFVELDEPTRWPASVDPAEALWWQDPPGAWRATITLPVLVRPETTR